MEFAGLVLKPKKVIASLLLLIFGISLIFYGLTLIYIDSTRFQAKMSDEEIIERAKKLGLIELKDYINGDFEVTEPATTVEKGK